MLYREMIRGGGVSGDDIPVTGVQVGPKVTWRRSKKRPESGHGLAGGQEDGQGTQREKEHMWRGAPGRRGSERKDCE